MSKVKYFLDIDFINHNTGINEFSVRFHGDNNNYDIEHEETSSLATVYWSESEAFVDNVTHYMNEIMAIANSKNPDLAAINRALKIMQNTFEQIGDYGISKHDLNDPIKRANYVNSIMGFIGYDPCDSAVAKVWITVATLEIKVDGHTKIFICPNDRVLRDVYILKD